MKNKEKKLIWVIFFVVVFLGLFSVFYMAVDITNRNVPLNEIGEEKEDKSKLKSALETGLVILIIILVVLGVFIGFRKLQLAEQEEHKKRYLRVNKEFDDEYKLEYGERIYYLKKKDLKWK
jgi:formate hydrogenlyase subunit 3/multisubunit Na+/H+ antiporter MnhD subunit